MCHMAYRYQCTRCGFGGTTETLDEVWDLEKDHTNEYGVPHFVEFERIE